MISDPMASPTSSPAPLVGGGTSLLPPVTADDAVRRAVEGRELLSHPFYQRWQAGQLAQGELADYAVQYLWSVLDHPINRMPDNEPRRTATTDRARPAKEVA